MVIGYSTILLGTQELNLKSLSRRKIPGTIKEKVGGKLVKHTIPARSTRDWEISARGVIFDVDGLAATTARKALENTYDNLETHGYSDGLIVATVIVENLVFPDSEKNPLHYTYSIKMIEYNQN